MGYKLDIEIVCEVNKKLIMEIGVKFGMELNDLLLYGYDKVKVS